MKTLLFTLIAFGTSVTLSRAEWGFITMLRSEPEPSCQRVGFVGSGMVKQVDGQAEHLSGIDCWSQVKAGMKLKSGDVLRTGNGTVVLKMLESQSFVKVTPNTIVRLLPTSDPSLRASTDSDSAFVIRSCRGPAFYRAENSAWRAVSVNSTLPGSATIRTEPGTTLDLFCSSTHHAIRLQGSKEVRLSSFAEPEPKITSLAAVTR